MERRAASLFAAYNGMNKADFVVTTDRQLAPAEEPDHVRNAVKRLAELTEYVAAIVAHDLYVQHSATASGTSKHPQQNYTITTQPFIYAWFPHLCPTQGLFCKVFDLKAFEPHSINAVQCAVIHAQWLGHRSLAGRLSLIYA